MEICWNDHLGTFHSLSAPQPPKNGEFLNRVVQIVLQRSRNWTLQAFFKRCRQMMNPSKGTNKRLSIQIPAITTGGRGGEGAHNSPSERQISRVVS